MEKISLLLPSRQRPHFMRRVWETALKTCEFENDLEIVFVLDDDDTFSIMEAKQMSQENRNVKFVVQPRDTNLSRLWNKACKISTGSIFMHLGDDIVFRSDDWDTHVRNVFNRYDDRIVFVYGRDGIVDKPVMSKDGQITTYTSHFGTHGFIHRNWVDTVGYFVPPYFVSDYNDTWLNEVSEKLQRKVFLPEVFTEHMHFTAGKATMDQNTRERLVRHQETKVDHLYASEEMKQRRQSDVDKLNSFIDQFKKQKEQKERKLQDVKQEEQGEKEAKIGFIGVGKLGLPVCIAMGMKGHKVIGYDVNPKIRPGVKAKDLLFTEEEGYDGQSIQELAEKYGPEFAQTMDDIVCCSSLIFVAVQTPHDPEFEGTKRLSSVSERKDFDYKYLKDSLIQLRQAIDKYNEVQPPKHFTIIVISTVLPGTVRREILPLLSDNKYIHFGYNPYFIAMGTVIPDFLKPEFILLGMNEKTPDAVDRVQEFYKTCTNRPVYRTTIENAEIIKVTYNTMISTKIMFVNLIMEICHKTPNANTDQVTDALKMATDRLISPAYMTGGLGDGGGCHPRDNIAMSYLCDKLNIQTNLFDHIMIGREHQAEFMAQLILEQSQKHPTLPVVVLGTAFKAETNINTGSPTLLMCSILDEHTNLHYTTFDPHINKTENTNNTLATDEYKGLLNPNQPRIYFLGCKHKCFQEISFPSGSVVIDPFRYLKPTQKQYVTVVSVGVGKSI